MKIDLFKNIKSKAYCAGYKKAHEILTPRIEQFRESFYRTAKKNDELKNKMEKLTTDNKIYRETLLSLKKIDTSTCILVSNAYQKTVANQ